MGGISLATFFGRVPLLEVVWVLVFRVQAQDFWTLARKFCEEYQGILRKIDADRFQKDQLGPKGRIQNILLG
jgi:hypothetical protein